MSRNGFLNLTIVLILAVTVLGVTVLERHFKYLETIPATQVVQFQFVGGGSGYLLTTTRVFGSHQNGLPNSGDTFSIEPSLMEMDDIYVLQEEGESHRYIKSSQGKFLAYPSLEMADQVRRYDRRILFFQDSILVAGGVQNPNQPLEAQIQAVANSVGGSITPLLFMDGDIWSPGFCYDTADMASCQFRGVRATAANVTGFIPGDQFQFMVLDHVPFNETTEYSTIFIPMSQAEVDAFQRCLEQINPNAGPSEVCEV